MATKTKKESPPRSYLRPQQRDVLENERRENQELIDATNDIPKEGQWSPTIPEGVSVNKNRLKARNKQLEKVLEEEGPRRVSDPKERQRLFDRRKELERRFLPFLETWKDIQARPGDPDYSEAVRKGKARHMVNNDILEWRRCGILLEPEDPTINDLDRLRKRG